MFSKGGRPLRAEQSQEMVEFGRQVERGTIAREAGDDAAMLLHEPGRFKGLAELLPLQHGVCGNPGLFVFGQSVYSSRQGADRLLHAFIRRRKLEPCIERFQVRPEFFTQALQRIVRGSG